MRLIPRTNRINYNHHLLTFTQDTIKFLDSYTM